MGSSRGRARPRAQSLVSALDHPTRFVEIIRPDHSPGALRAKLLMATAMAMLRFSVLPAPAGAHLV